MISYIKLNIILYKILFKRIFYIIKDMSSELKLDEIKEYKFGTSDLVVPIRADGMIDATALCKAGNKKLNHYIENKNTKEYLDALESDTGIPVSQLITIHKGNSKSFTQGTWVHRKVGYHLAQWLSPKFAVQVSNILDELFITGKVELGNEKSNEELERQYKEQIEHLSLELNTNKKELETTKNNYQTLLVKHNSSLKKHNYVKFKESGPCFYIVDPGIKCECIFNTYRKKFGIAGISTKNEQLETVDKRLKSHRTTWPLLKVEFILFTKQAIMIEKNFKIIYEKQINPNGHEIIEGVSTEVMIDKVKQLLEFLSIKDFYIIPNEKLLEYNNYVDTTVKNSNIFEEEDDNEVIVDKEDDDNEVVLEEDDDDKVVVEEEDDDDNVEVVENNKVVVVEEKVEVVVEEKVVVVEEKVEVVEDLKKYKEMLENIQNFKYDKLTEILRSLNLSPSGVKEKRRETLKIFLLDKLSIKKNTRICDICNIDKQLDDTNFVITKNYQYKKYYSNTCIPCEIEKCKRPERNLEKTEIKQGMETLLCFKCKETKSVLDFFKDKSRVDRGYEYYCKNCELFSKHGTYDVPIRIMKQKPDNIPEDKKWCIYCEEILELDKFCPNKKGEKGYASNCRQCYNKKRRERERLQKINESQPANGN